MPARGAGDRAGRPVDPLRFRAKAYIDNLPAWDEFKCAGKELTIRSAKLAEVHRTQRCAATNGDPSNVGVYAKVTAAGPISLGNRVMMTEGPVARRPRPTALRTAA